jgi:predicted Zn-dependent protease
MADSVDWDRLFPITSVSRNDVADIVGEEMAEKLTDGDMERLASRMRDAYCESYAFWDQIDIIVPDLIGKR